MQWTKAWAVLLALAVTAPLAAEEPVFSYPLIKGYGGIAIQPDAAEPPRRGAKIVFDITADTKDDEVHRGIEAVARYLNLNAQAGNAPSDVKLAVVLHGGATKAALGDAAYAKHITAMENPNLALIHELKACGVEVFVCGQSLARNKFIPAEVAGDVTLATSAMTVNVNKQLAGYAYLSIH